MFGNLYVHFLRWRSDSRESDQEIEVLQNKLEYLVTELRTNLQWLVAWVNAQGTIPAVGLTDYWTDGSTESQGSTVAAAYTAKGKEQVDDRGREKRRKTMSTPERLSFLYPIFRNANIFTVRAPMI